MGCTLEYEPVDSLTLWHVTDADNLDHIRAHGLSAQGEHITMGLYAFTRRPDAGMLDSVRDRLAGAADVVCLRFEAPEDSTWWYDGEYPDGEHLAVLSQDCGVIPWPDLEVVPLD